MNTETTTGFDPSHELLTIPEFAKRIRRSKEAVYKSIRQGRMPAASVVYIHGGAMRIDWTVYAAAMRIRP